MRTPDVVIAAGQPWRVDHELSLLHLLPQIGTRLQVGLDLAGIRLDLGAHPHEVVLVVGDFMAGVNTRVGSAPYRSLEVLRRPLLLSEDTDR